MKRCMLWTMVGVVCVVATALAASAVGPQDRSLGATERIAVTGCIQVPTGGVYLLRNAVPSIAGGRNAAGMTSSKASVPISAAPSNLGGRRSAAGANTSKGSTPISRAPNTLRAAGSAGMTSSKASAPIRRRADVASMYELDTEAAQLSPHAGHTVEITGTIEHQGTGISTTTTPKLKVESIKMVSSACPEL